MCEAFSLDRAADGELDAAQVAGAHGRLVEDVRGEVGGRRLAVGAGHADHAHRASGMAVEPRRGFGERDPAVRHRDEGHVLVDVRCQRVLEILLDDDEAGAGGDGVRR